MVDNLHLHSFINKKFTFPSQVFVRSLDHFLGKMRNRLVLVLILMGTPNKLSFLFVSQIFEDWFVDYSLSFLYPILPIIRLTCSTRDVHHSGRCLLSESSFSVSLLRESLRSSEKRVPQPFIYHGHCYGSQWWPIRLLRQNPAKHISLLRP